MIISVNQEEISNLNGATRCLQSPSAAPWKIKSAQRARFHTAEIAAAGKDFIFRGCRYRIHAKRILLGKGVEDLLDEQFRYRCTGGDSQSRHAIKHLPI